MVPRRRLFALLTSALLAVLASAGCGGDDSTTPPDPEQAAETPAIPATDSIHAVTLRPKLGAREAPSAVVWVDPDREAALLERGVRLNDALYFVPGNGREQQPLADAAGALDLQLNPSDALVLQVVAKQGDRFIPLPHGRIEVGKDFWSQRPDSQLPLPMFLAATQAGSEVAFDESHGKLAVSTLSSQYDTAVVLSSSSSLILIRLRVVRCETWAAVDYRVFNIFGAPPPGSPAGAPPPGRGRAQRPSRARPGCNYVGVVGSSWGN